MEKTTDVRSIDPTLIERGARYGVFYEHATIAQALKSTIVDRPGYIRMQPDARQTVDVIFDKIARMINGDPEYDDNWRDIIGYATLVLDRINKTGIYAPQEQTSEHVHDATVYGFASLGMQLDNTLKKSFKDNTQEGP